MITKDTARPIGTLVTVCNILVDSAETVAEANGDPDTRAKTFEFADKVPIKCKLSWTNNQFRIRFDHKAKRWKK